MDFVSHANYAQSRLRGARCSEGAVFRARLTGERGAHMMPVTGAEGGSVHTFDTYLPCIQ